MSDDQLGLTGSVSMALGGMIGGGIYAVLGVVATIAGPATWMAFVAAGAVALAAGYSYVKLDEVDDRNTGGSARFVQCFVGNSTLAGMVGWTLLFGYVGSMAMYAFAFSAFALELVPWAGAVGGVPLRPLVSVAAVAGFVGLNLLGAQASGSAENVMVGVKVAVLALFGLAGLVYSLGFGGPPIDLGLAQATSFGPVMAAAVSFVAFQGWQLLFYDQESIEDPVSTIQKAVFVSIPVAVAIYVLVGVTTVALAPGAIRHHPHVALARAAANIMAPLGLAGLGSTAIALSALFSTGSAINATLFSTGYLAKGLVSDDLLPDRAGDTSAGGLPTRTVVLLGLVTAAFSAYGSLAAITSFASLTFIAVFGAVSLLALRQRDHEAVHPVPPAVGTAGSLLFLPLMFYHLYRSEPGTFQAVLVLAVLVVGMELLYFERDLLEEEIDRFETAVAGSDESLPPET